MPKSQEILIKTQTNSEKGIEIMVTSKKPQKKGLTRLSKLPPRVGIALNVLVSLSEFPSRVGIALSAHVSLSELSKV